VARPHIAIRSAGAVVLASGFGGLAGTMQSVATGGAAYAQPGPYCSGSIVNHDPFEDEEDGNDNVGGTSDGFETLEDSPVLNLDIHFNGTIEDHLDSDCTPAGPLVVGALAESSLYKLLKGSSQWEEVDPTGSGCSLGTPCWNTDATVTQPIDASTDDSYSCGNLVACTNGSAYKDVFGAYIATAPGVIAACSPDEGNDFPATCTTVPEFIWTVSSEGEWADYPT
jgi:hypothetical protein